MVARGADEHSSLHDLIVRRKPSFRKVLFRSGIIDEFYAETTPGGIGFGKAPCVCCSIRNGVAVDGSNVIDWHVIKYIGGVFDVDDNIAIDPNNLVERLHMRLFKDQAFLPGRRTSSRTGWHVKRLVEYPLHI